MIPQDMPTGQSYLGNSSADIPISDDSRLSQVTVEGKQDSSYPGACVAHEKVGHT